MKKITVLSALLSLIFSSCDPGNRTKNIPAVKDFDLSRYMGVWYEIARYPHGFEKGMSHVSAEYTLESNGRVKVINKGIRDGRERKITGIARQRQPGSGELEVSFFRPFYGAYRIIYLSPGYDFAIVTSSSKKYLWLLSRTPEVSEETKTFFLQWIQLHGFSPENLIRVDQHPRETFSSEGKE